MVEKTCWKCTLPKALAEFCRDGQDSVCKLCRYELNAQWSKNNREKLRPKRAEYMKKYRAAKAAEKAMEEAHKALLPDPIDPDKDPTAI